MRLDTLLQALGQAKVENFEQADVAAVTSDSREVRPGSVFVAVRGVHVDGHEFIGDAARRGAVAMVVDRPVEALDVTCASVDDSSRALALLASRFYGDPSASLRMFGATGTNGKTSTTRLFRSICETASWGRMGIIGTVGHDDGQELETAVHTTPEPVTLHRLLSGMKENGCIGVVMEVSSHAVRQQRTWGIDFEIGMLTNVTRDHLDYHSSFDDYIDAKREFCYSLVSAERRKKAGTLVYSCDNDIARNIGDGFPGTKVSTSVAKEADVFATEIDATLEGTNFTLHLRDGTAVPVSMRLLGEFSVANAVMAAAAADWLAIDAINIRLGLEAVAGVPGRFEALGGKGKPVVVVDYSHTPDSLQHTLEFCRRLRPKRLITVFGCGGDRDRGKRPLMGQIAERMSDLCLVTSDNPRTEDPDAIIAEILGGMERTSRTVIVEPNRRRAIQEAVRRAQADDLVAVCGKGHEDYQIIGTTKHHFDDREEALDALKTWESI